MGDFVEIWVLGLFAAAVRYATPLVLAGLGGLFSERAGIVNIALEGMMVAGAFFAIFGSDLTGHWLGGLLFGIAGGMLLGLLHAVATVTFRADQIISGTALILIAAGFVNYLNITLYPAPQGTPANVSRPPEILGFGLLVPVMVGLVFLTIFVVFRTPFGLRMRAVGEHPKAADTVGIDVYRMRYIAVLISGAFAGLAGAYLSFDVGSYTEGMVAGKGFIALAALIFGKWNPVGVLGASLLFGGSQALADRLGSVSAIPEALRAPELLTALPYLITIVALAGFVGKSVGPAAVGKPYQKG
jgi:general nucleoside transport system permease protein